MTRDEAAKKAHDAFYKGTVEYSAANGELWREVADAIGPRCAGRVEMFDYEVRLGLKPCTLPAWHCREKEPCR